MPNPCLRTTPPKRTNHQIGAALFTKYHAPSIPIKHTYHSHHQTLSPQNDTTLNTPSHNYSNHHQHHHHTSITTLPHQTTPHHHHTTTTPPPPHCYHTTTTTLLLHHHHHTTTWSLACTGTMLMSLTALN